MKTIREHLTQVPYFGTCAIKETYLQNSEKLDEKVQFASDALITSFSFNNAKILNKDTWSKVYNHLAELEKLAYVNGLITI